MAYATYADLVEVLRETIASDVTADSGTTIDPVIGASAITNAEAKINGYLGNKTYSASEVATLKIHTLIIAKSIVLGRPLSEKYDPGLDADLARTYEWLKETAAGKYGIFGTPAAVTSTGTSGGIWRSNTQIYDTTYYRGGF